MKTFQVPSQIVGVRSLGDGGLSVNIHTKELSTVEKASIMEFHNSAGWFLFSENEFTDTDVPKQQAEYDGKTPSQRLRAVLFIYWKQLGEKEDFEVFYRANVERVINAVKAKLEI